MKKIISLAIIIVLTGIGCATKNVENKSAMQNKCFAWSEYEPGIKAWRWMSNDAVKSGKGGYFPSRQEAIDNCLATFSSVSE